jgi:hypothetical protein
LIATLSVYPATCACFSRKSFKTLLARCYAIEVHRLLLNILLKDQHSFSSP